MTSIHIPHYIATAGAKSRSLKSRAMSCRAQSYWDLQLYKRYTLRWERTGLRRNEAIGTLDVRI